MSRKVCQRTRRPVSCVSHLPALNPAVLAPLPSRSRSCSSSRTPVWRMFTQIVATLVRASAVRRAATASTETWSRDTSSSMESTFRRSVARSSFDWRSFRICSWSMASESHSMRRLLYRVRCFSRNSIWRCILSARSWSSASDSVRSMERFAVSRRMAAIFSTRRRSRSTPAAWASADFAISLRSSASSSVASTSRRRSAASRFERRSSSLSAPAASFLRRSISAPHFLYSLVCRSISLVFPFRKESRFSSSDFHRLIEALSTSMANFIPFILRWVLMVCEMSSVTLSTSLSASLRSTFISTSMSNRFDDMERSRSFTTLSPLIFVLTGTVVWPSSRVRSRTICFASSPSRPAPSPLRPAARPSSASNLTLELSAWSWSRSRISRTSPRRSRSFASRVAWNLMRLDGFSRSTFVLATSLSTFARSCFSFSSTFTLKEMSFSLPSCCLVRRANPRVSGKTRTLTLPTSFAMKSAPLSCRLGGKD